MRGCTEIEGQEVTRVVKVISPNSLMDDTKIVKKPPASDVQPIKPYAERRNNKPLPVHASRETDINRQACTQAASLLVEEGGRWS